MNATSYHTVNNHKNREQEIKSCSFSLQMSENHQGFCTFLERFSKWLRGGVLEISCTSRSHPLPHNRYKFSKFITSFTITSFSSGLDSAIIKVMATRVPSLMRLTPFWNKALFLFRNSRKRDASILLQPSAYASFRINSITYRQNHIQVIYLRFSSSWTFIGKSDRSLI